MHTEKCPTCKGRGTIDKPEDWAHCYATGYDIPQQTCPSCHGMSYVEVSDVPPTSSTIRKAISMRVSPQ